MSHFPNSGKWQSCRCTCYENIQETQDIILLIPNNDNRGKRQQLHAPAA